MSGRSVDVVCYSGSRGDEEPRAFVLDGERIDVVGINKRWMEPGVRCFEVRAPDGNRYTLRHEEEVDAWTLVSVRRADA